MRIFQFPKFNAAMTAALISAITILPGFAFANREHKVCASTLNEFVQSPSPAIQALVKTIVSPKNIGFNNKTNTSHIVLRVPDEDGGRIVFQLHSTSKVADPNDPGEYEFRESTAEVCDNGKGVLSLNSSQGSVNISHSEGCFRLNILFASEERTTFCYGKMPVHIAGVRRSFLGTQMAKDIAANPNVGIAK